MKLLLMPGVPLAAIYFSHGMANLTLPMPWLLTLTGGILFLLSIVVLLWLISNKSRR
jgi:hypothetical protein